jgi:hypothetical protein
VKAQDIELDRNDNVNEYERLFRAFEEQLQHERAKTAKAEEQLQRERAKAKEQLQHERAKAKEQLEIA